MKPMENVPGSFDMLLESYSKGTLTRRELASSTGLVFGEVLVELGKRSLPLPIVSPRRRPEQDALFERALRGGE